MHDTIKATDHRSRRRAALTTPVLLIALLAAFLALVLLLGDRSLARWVTEVLVRVTLVVGFWIFVGNSGVISFGHAAFACVGAYVSAWLTLRPSMKALLLPGLPDWLAQADWPPLAAALAGAGVAAVFALITGAAILRLSGIAAAIATFAFLAMINTIWSNWSSVTGGTSSVVGLVRYVTPWVALGWAAAAILAAAAYARSRSGLALRATREDEVAAAASGIDKYRHRLAAFTLSAFFCGAGGALSGHVIGVVNPDAFYLSLTFMMLAMLVVGGSASLTGAVVGVLVVSVALEGLARMERGITLGEASFSLPIGSQQILIAIAMILILILRPQGLTAGREVMLPLRRVAQWHRKAPRPEPTEE